MLARVTSAAIHGIDGRIVAVEVDAAQGLPALAVVGLPDAGVKESKDRVRAAITNSGYAFPPRKFTVNLAPGDIPKEGPSFDLPIALGVLLATEQASPARTGRYAFAGELGLDGTVRPIQGVLSLALECRRCGLQGIVVPAQNAPEAALVEGIEAIPVETLGDAAGFASGSAAAGPVRVDPVAILRADEAREEADFADVRGQEPAKRAFTIAAAGGHNVLLLGPPGAGKTMLARRLPTILPRLSVDEALETTRIHSVAETLPAGRPLVARRPFRAPHHTVSAAGLVGGGTWPRPGETSLAHHGVLFLDELPEFTRHTLEVLRQPLEDGFVTISRASGSLSFPSRFMLVAAMNPCPCGYLGHPRRPCRCTPHQVASYRGKISGPLLDRIDIHVEVPAISFEEVAGEGGGTASAEIRAAVQSAREVQSRRYGGRPGVVNASMPSRLARRLCAPTDEARALLKEAMESLGLSARAFTKVLRVARTIADLERAESVEASHVAEAIQYRALDRVAV